MNEATNALDLNKLENVQSKYGKTTAACPACREQGGDKKGDHLFINEATGQYGCIANQGDDGVEHRKVIYRLAGLPVQASTPCTANKLANVKPALTLETQAVEAPACKAYPHGSFNTIEAAIAHYTETKKWQCAGRWNYTDANGETICAVLRFNFTEDDGKAGRHYFPFHPVDGGWQFGWMEEPRPLYNLPAVMASPRVYVAEGEKCAEALNSLGLCGTTSPVGANGYAKADWSPLAGRQVVILPDNDKPGAAYAKGVLSILQKLTPPAQAVILEYNEIKKLGEGADVFDWQAEKDTAPVEVLAGMLEGEAVKLLNALPVAVPVASVPAVAPSVPVEAVPVESRTEAASPVAAAVAVPATLSGNTDWTWHGVAKLCNADNNYAFNKALGWLKWTGQRWLVVEDTHVKQDVLAFAEENAHKAIAERNKDAEEVFYRLRNSALPTFMEVFKSQAYASIELFTEAPWQLNVTNGILDLRTGVLAPHKRSYSLHQCKVGFNPAAEMAEWNTFVAQVFPDPATAHYVQVLFGYAITGCVQEQMFALFHGIGCNGKSTLCNAISSVIGDYSGEIPTSELAVKKFQGENTPYLVRCVGKRLVFANEPPEGMVLNDSVIKALASRDRISMCAKYGAAFECMPSWLLTLRCNNRPIIKATDDGIWRRVKEVPFTVQFTKPDKGIEERLVNNHGTAILRWLVEGAQEYAVSGLPACPQVEVAGMAYRKAQDSIEAWFEARVEKAPASAVMFAELHEDYKAWCVENSAYESTFVRLSNALARRGFEKVPGGRGKYIGLKLKVEL